MCGRLLLCPPLPAHAREAHQGLFEYEYYACRHKASSRGTGTCTKKTSGSQSTLQRLTMNKAPRFEKPHRDTNTISG